MKLTCRKKTHLFEKETARLWGDPLKWMRYAVTLWKFHSEVVFVSYHFPSPLLCNVKATYIPLST